MDVTADNLIFYIHAMADYKLNQRIAAQTRAFLTGYYEVIKPEWLRCVGLNGRVLGGQSRH